MSALLGFPKEILKSFSLANVVSLAFADCFSRSACCRIGNVPHLATRFKVLSD